jgi:hypothetical protein
MCACPLPNLLDSGEVPEAPTHPLPNLLDSGEVLELLACLSVCHTEHLFSLTVLVVRLRCIKRKLTYESSRNHQARRS